MFATVTRSGPTSAPRPSARWQVGARPLEDRAAPRPVPSKLERLALDAGDDGLAVLWRIVDGAP